MRRISTGSLIARTSSTTPADGTSSSVDQLAEPPVRFDGQVRVVEPEPPGEALQRRQQLLRPLLLVEPVDLDLGLLDVAEVGHEAAHVAADQREPVGAGEARDVAQVRGLGDEQRVDVLQAARDPVRPAHHVSLSNSNASRYPSTPLPETLPTRTSSSTDTCRNASRASTSERWTSIVGSPQISTASRSDHA